MHGHVEGQSGPSGSPGWARKWLIAAGIYNLVWGAAVVLFPNLLFDATGIERPAYPQIWQCVGMIVGVYGIGYLAAARDSRRHWPIVLVGLLGKIFGPIGFAQGVATGALPWQFGLTIPTNDLIWWIPFGMMLWDAAKHSGGYAVPRDVPSLADALRSSATVAGTPLIEITSAAPTLVVLVRHAGCTFCKEALADLAQQSDRLRDAGVQVAIVTMSDERAAASLASRSNIPGAHWVSDPERRLYGALELGRGSFAQLFGLRVWVRGFLATLKGHGVGKLDGDGFQMPGAFVIEGERVLKSYRHAHAADRLDHAAFACELPGASA